MEPIFRSHACRIQLPIFFCHDCQMIYIDKATIKRIVKEWNVYQRFLLKQLYDEFFSKLEESVNFYLSCDYENVRFLKNIKKLSP